MTLVTVLLTGAMLTTAADPWQWPLKPAAPRIVRGFSPPPDPWLPGHRGVDLAARPGQPVYAAGPGRVSYTGDLAGRGVIAITHGILRTTYLPVRPAVRLGRQVTAGTRIGVLQAAPQHCPAEPCLHWGLLNGQVYLDPLALVRPQVRLLPLWPPPRDASNPERPAPYKPEPRLDLRDATTATGGAVAGMLLALALSLAWRTTRVLLRRKPPPGVIDLAQERRQRRP